jgi:hypothetical protein
MSEMFANPAEKNVAIRAVALRWPMSEMSRRRTIGNIQLRRRSFIRTFDVLSNLLPDLRPFCQSPAERGHKGIVAISALFAK